MRFFAVILILTFLAPTEVLAAEIFGQVKVVVEGFRGYNATVREDLTIQIKGTKIITRDEGYFHLTDHPLQLSSSQSEIDWEQGNGNVVAFHIGKANLKIPVNWIGWQEERGRVFLQPITCYVDQRGRAFCRSAANTRKQLRKKYALRFGIADLRVDREPVEPAHGKNPTPAATPQIVRPQPIKPKPAAKPIARPNQPSTPEIVRPSGPAPQANEPEIIGPAD